MGHGQYLVSTSFGEAKMEFPEELSFTPLATVQLPKPHILHPQACNPTMGLVVLLSRPAESSSRGIPTSAIGKGKSKAAGCGRIAVWRMLGSKVWEVDVDGVVAGLAWTRDGMYGYHSFHRHSFTNRNLSL